MAEKQIKSKERVSERGEVFTAEREVKAMCDLVADECARVDATFLEPACGDGNFLAEVLHRKLETVTRESKRDTFRFEVASVLAISSLYGIDIMQDNVLACRDRIFSIWEKEYKRVCKKAVNQEMLDTIRYILSLNIVCGNALTMMCVDENCEDTDEPIIFPEWKFFTETLVKRRDYRFDVLLKENPDENMYCEQFSLFGEDTMGSENWEIDPITKELTPKPVREFQPIHYRRLSENVELV